MKPLRYLSPWNFSGAFSKGVSGCAVACAMLYAGCGTPRGNVEEAVAALGTAGAEDAVAQRAPERREVTWDEAWQLAERRNPRLREARASLVNADAQIDRVWLDLLPATSVSYSIDRALEQIVKGGGHGSGTLSVFAFLNIPGVVSLRMRYYSAVLSRVRMEFAYELAVREQRIALWRLFRDYDRFRERRAWAGYTRRLIGAGMDFSGAALSAYLSDYALEREEQSLQSRFGQMFGTLKCHWTPKGAAPSHDYGAAEVEGVGDAANFGLLQLQLAACELEGARLRTLGAQLAFWPDISGGLSAPPIYQTSNGNEGEKWRWENIYARASLSWSVDTRLSNLYNLAETKRQVALIRDRLVLGNQQRTQALLDARRALVAQARQAAQVERKLLALRTAPTPVTMEQFSSFATELRSLIEQRASLSAERDTLNSLFWEQDEKHWPRATAAQLDALNESDREMDKETEEYFNGAKPKPAATKT
jgi:hypothetical protein